MKNKTLLISVLACFFASLLFSQEEPKLTSKDSIVKSSWMLGLGYNIVDDSGDVFDELFAVNSQWNALPYPSRISIGRYFKNGLGIEAIASYNKYKVGKIIDGATNVEESDYLGLDARISYDLNRLVGETGWFDPYLGVGLGYTDANNNSRGTYNAVVGFRAWFSDRWGLDFSSSGKWAINKESGITNHLQHAAGVVYQFGIEKGLSKKGEEKLALIQAMEQEKQRVQDSIAAVNRAKEEAALAERLEREREKARLAAVEKAKQDAENDRRKQLENKIKDLGHVYFALNSSYLDRKSKSILDSLAVILATNPTMELKITSHTDSRGSSDYNKWLSERRVERTINYLRDKGISLNRLTYRGLGEESLMNECDDNTYCPEEKHRENRRSEFMLIGL
ncbi:OmpA family protein [Flavobacteriaceae bacterium TP-CH-4]|uniref:OmpA family protein n=1 Tax=Pelagihabitans pacificus TaxID=2696054 RepID=A0A967B315_9FLAO|nr:OmpA family protein [Pelagihabitans pacificus]NHF61091.1 OmpA family protein [Pelagihabitans pacificus]